MKNRGTCAAIHCSLCKSIRSEFFLNILNNMHATINQAWKCHLEFNYLQVNMIIPSNMLMSTPSGVFFYFPMGPPIMGLN